MNQAILFVDDDVRTIAALQRCLHKEYRMDVACSPQDGLNAISETSYAVVVSDFRMPGMDGIEFLDRVRQLAPDAVQILLTGEADLETAVAAVNDGHIFRFLKKPCPRELLSRALDAALGHHHCLRDEKEALHQTVIGAIGVLVQLLARLQPLTFGRSLRIQKLMKRLACELNLGQIWELEAAGLLSHIGCISVEPQVLQKYFAGVPLRPDEMDQIAAHPREARQMLQGVARLDAVSEIIARQMEPFEESSNLPPHALKIAIGAQLLGIASDFDRLCATGLTPAAAAAAMCSNRRRYSPELLDGLIRLEKRLGLKMAESDQDCQAPFSWDDQPKVGGADGQILTEEQTV